MEPRLILAGTRAETECGDEVLTGTNTNMAQASNPIFPVLWLLKKDNNSAMSFLRRDSAGLS